MLQQNQVLELTDRLITVTYKLNTLQNEVKEKKGKQQCDCQSDDHSWDSDVELLNRMEG